MDSVASAAAPLLEAHAARVAVDDVVMIEALTATTNGQRVLCAGDTGALFAALTGVPLSASRAGAPGGDGRTRAEDDDASGEARVVAGRLALAGGDVSRGSHRELVGVAPLDPPLPPGMTAEAYVTWGARLAGVSARVAAAMAPAALVRVGLAAARKRSLRALGLSERRALVIAQAIVTSPSAVLIEDPLAGLDDAAAAFVLAAISGATEGRGAVLSMSELDGSGPRGVLARGATDVLVLSGGELAFAGSFADLAAGTRVYSLTVRDNAAPLRSELAAQGITLAGGPHRFSVALPEGAGTREIVLAAARTRAPIVELCPIWS